MKLQNCCEKDIQICTRKDLFQIHGAGVDEMFARVFRNIQVSISSYVAIRRCICDVANVSSSQGRKESVKTKVLEFGKNKCCF